MAERPWFKWYPTDWRSDPKLRLCGAAARGVWIDLLGLMYEAEPVGNLMLNGRQPTAEQLAMLISLPVREVANAMKELEENGVFSRDSDGTIYSRRMRRDAKRSLTGKAYAGKRWGGEASEPNGPPNGGGYGKPNGPANGEPNGLPNGKPNAQSPESRVSGKVESSLPRESTDRRPDVSHMPRLCDPPHRWAHFGEDQRVDDTDPKLVQRPCISGEFFDKVCRLVCEAAGITDDQHRDDWTIVAGWLRECGHQVNVERDILIPIRNRVRQGSTPNIWTVGYFTRMLREHWAKAA